MGGSCGENTDNSGTHMANQPIHADSSCDCARICKVTPKCEAWTYSTGTFTIPSGDFSGAMLNCWLRSTFGDPTDNNCGNDCWSSKKEISHMEVAVVYKSRKQEKQSCIPSCEPATVLRDCQD